ncbi:hypothetical protein HMF8227_00685 [Saliniradius amylolyticus]|uniref:Peptidase M61 catalytic domain-containing protein n=1 Tax=Saliniradius amylolyticus TaxID=2183582 RepID=A0A2S2E0L0_9ALTE|nr:hypothetical protein [Saliniradius amylolyticus]AWL11181.1 hypothetical protein HMF8227_00685 [Saliniradius amylolyticus]
MRYIWMLLAAVLSGPVVAQGYLVKGLSQFSASEQAMLRAWLDSGEAAMHRLLGPLPFVTHIHLYPRRGAEPVPWAHTWKGARKSLHLYVDTDFGANDFTHDWTLYHEWSHLALPYLGEQHRWWAEGFASYMQYHLMEQVGVLRGSAEGQLQRRWRQYQHYFHSNEPLGVQAQSLIQQGQYPPAYWAGAQYFIRVQQRLPHKDLMSLVAKYTREHYNAAHGLKNVLEILDRLAGKPVFSNTYRQMTEG